MSRSKAKNAVFGGKKTVKLRPSKARTATIGMLWVFSNTVVSKFLTFLTQLALGWLLAPGEFGLYAIAVSISGFVGMMRNGGIEQILIKNGGEYSELAPIAASFSLYFNIATMLLLCAVGAFVNGIYESEELFAMLVIISLAAPIGTPAVLLRAKMSVDSRFKELAALKTGGALARQGGTMLFAFAGFGVYSFVIPIILEAATEVALGYLFVREMPRMESISGKAFKAFFTDARWVMVGTLVLSLAMTGDFFLLGIILERENLGIYFFGLQIVVAVSVLFSTPIGVVLLPILAPLSGDPERLASVLRKAVSGVFLIAAPVAALLALLAQPVIHFLWNGKWDEAINVVQVFSIAMPFWLFVFISRSALESCGLWRKRLSYLASYGLLSMSAAVAAAVTHNIVLVALAVAIVRGIIGLVQLVWIFRLAGAPVGGVLMPLMKTTVTTVVSGVIAYQSRNLIFPGAGELVKLLITLSTFSLLFILASISWQRQQVDTLLGVLKSN